MPDPTPIPTPTTAPAPVQGNGASGPVIHLVTLDPNAAASAQPAIAQPTAAAQAAPAQPAAKSFGAKVLDFLKEHRTPVLTATAALAGMEYERRRHKPPPPENKPENK